jgi:hypothetical protein
VQKSVSLYGRLAYPYSLQKDDMMKAANMPRLEKEANELVCLISVRNIMRYTRHWTCDEIIVSPAGVHS